MQKSRTSKSMKNSIVALCGQVFSIILSFAARTVFIRMLGTNYLGINGLFTNILSLLSFAELGFGTAIIYAMYKPLAENDEKKISAYMNLYAIIYKVIGLFILIVGLGLIPFLSFFIGDTSQIPTDLPPIQIIYVLYLINSSASYFFNYKRSIIIASQNGYLDSLNQLEFTLLRNILQIFVLLFLKSFMAYLLIQIICTILGNIMISLKADKLFPYLNQHKKERLSFQEIKTIMKNVLAMTCHKFGSVIVSGTDNILITKFVGLAATGRYSNYVLLKNTVRTVFLQILDPITASVGNLIATEKSEKGYELFKKILFLNSYIAIVFTTCLLALANPFVEIFWGADCLLPEVIVIMIMLNFYINCIRKTSQIFIDTNGLFWQIKWKSVIEAFVNLFFSILLGYYFKLGIVGILAGTIISNIFTNLWWEPYVVYKEYFKKKLYLYFIEYFKYFGVFLLSILPIYLLKMKLTTSFINFTIIAIVALAWSNIIIIVVFHSKIEFVYYRNLVFNYLKKIRKNKIISEED